MSLWQPLLGGILIGIASFMMHILIGRVAGISGILGKLVPSTAGERDWRLTFLAGLFGGGALMYALQPGAFSGPVGEPSLFTVIAAGLLVGFGTRLGSGCTSGHGVCGASRLSIRSLVATAAFISTGAVTVFVHGGVTP